MGWSGVAQDGVPEVRKGELHGHIDQSAYIWFFSLTILDELVLLHGGLLS